jgi:signal transduction histidine kinase
MRLPSLLLSSLLFASKKKKRLLYSVVVIVSIIVISYSLFFYLQYNIEKDTKDKLVAQQMENQIESTKKISTRISSDLNSIVVALHGLANSAYIQQGELYGDKTKNLLEETYFQINTITLVDRLFILDKRNIATIFIVPRGQNEPFCDSDNFFCSDNIPFEELVNQTRTKLVPTFSNGFKGLDNKYRIAITYPILNRDTEEYIGSIVALIPTVEFFENYGNVHNINKQYLTAFDKNGMYIDHPLENFMGKNFFFSSEFQQITEQSKNFNDLISKVVLYGQPSQAIYNYGNVERLGTGYPIVNQGKPIYSVFIITPTSIIYSQLSHVLFLERIEMFLLLAGTTAAVTFLIVFLLKWSSSLGKEVKRRTKELEELNKQLASANEQLKINDKMQKEFINVAAHELRTPLQPIISYSALALKDEVDKSEAMQVIDKHANRLRKLSTELLDVSRIEGGNFPYKMEKVRINDLILDVINNTAIVKAKANNNIRRSNKGKKWNAIKQEEEVLIDVDLDHNIEEIYADKDRIDQVLSNVIDNAIKFTKKGKIKIESRRILISGQQEEEEKKKKNNKIEIKISDTGGGIPEDILPRLFGKFVTKGVVGTENKHGSGLGLFISKAIVTAHKGEITAYNNENGGATFTIVLPIYGYDE